MKKKIIKSGASTTYENYISINYGNYEKVDFESVESIYGSELGASTYLVCPKSKYHPYDFGRKAYIIPNGISFNNGDNFSLKCYKHGAGSGIFIVAYLANGQKQFYAKKNNWNKDSFNLLYLLHKYIHLLNSTFFKKFKKKIYCKV